MNKHNNTSNRLIFTLFGILLTVTLLSSCSKDTATPTTPTNPVTFKDSRDGHVYKVVTIGTQTWMAQNLNYAAVSSWCYDSISSNCTTYGRLYDWQTAKVVCPSGWHLPTDAEWTILTAFLGGPNVAGGKMKSVTGWNAPNIGATNQSGFSALPGGSRNGVGSFFEIGRYGNWWSATESNAQAAWSRYLEYVNEDFFRYGEFAKELGLSVRCLKD